MVQLREERVRADGIIEDTIKDGNIRLEHSSTANSSAMISFLGPILIGLVMGFLMLKIAAIVGDNQSQINIAQIKIGYVSQREIMEYERKRIDKLPGEDSKDEDRQIFFAKSQRAADLISTLAKNYDNRDMKVVFSNDKVYGPNVISLSKEIHTAVIDRLKEYTKVIKKGQKQNLDQELIGDEE